jgi:membrane protein YqaA with SNARE-associated domain
VLESLSGLGYLGIFAGSFLAATVIPFSSDLLLIGALIAGSDPLFTFISATIGNWLGGLSSYYVGYLGKWEWIEKWFRVKRETLERQKTRINRHGSIIALLTWLPFIGDVLAIALGFYKVNFVKSAIFMLIGKGVRFLGWITLFLLFGAKFFDF